VRQPCASARGPAPSARQKRCPKRGGAAGAACSQQAMCPPPAGALTASTPSAPHSVLAMLGDSSMPRTVCASHRRFARPSSRAHPPRRRRGEAGAPCQQASRQGAPAAEARPPGSRAAHSARQRSTGARGPASFTVRPHKRRRCDGSMPAYPPPFLFPQHFPSCPPTGADVRRVLTKRPQRAPGAAEAC